MSKPTVEIILTKPTIEITGEVIENVTVAWDTIGFTWDAGVNWDSTFQLALSGKPIINIVQ